MSDTVGLPLLSHWSTPSAPARVVTAPSTSALIKETARMATFEEKEPAGALL